MTNTLRSIRRENNHPDRVLVLLPGYGDRPEPFLERASHFDPNGQWLVVVVEPHNSSDRGPFWYDVDENGPDPVALTDALAAVDTQLEALLSELGLTENGLVVAGFSQGGAIALAHLVDPNSRIRPAAVATLSGYLPTRDATLIDLSRSVDRFVLFAHGEDDELVEPVRGRSAAKALHRAGSTVTWNEVAGGHRFDSPLTDALKLWLDAIVREERPSAPPI